jgi:hypothetical protein
LQPLLGMVIMGVVIMAVALRMGAVAAVAEMVSNCVGP